jgi:hypothetical protein
MHATELNRQVTYLFSMPVFAAGEFNIDHRNEGVCNSSRPGRPYLPKPASYWTEHQILL